MSACSCGAPAKERGNGRANLCEDCAYEMMEKLLAHVSELATRPCGAPSDPSAPACGWCDSCEARTTLISAAQPRRVK